MNNKIEDRSKEELLKEQKGTCSYLTWPCNKFK